jgi:Arc/MetJ family transcription regulator
MRARITIDDQLLAAAEEMTGITDRSALLTEALKGLVARESARRLARLGGSCPDTKAPPRRRSKLSLRERFKILFKG